MSISVVDLNEEATKDEQPEQIEEATEQAPEPTIDTTNEVIEEATETPPVEKQTEEPKPKAKPRAKPKASDVVKCDKCDKSMSYKNLRYSHNCDPKPVKKQANPKAKQTPKPKPKPVPVPVYEEDEEQQPISSTPVKNQVFKTQPSNPLPSRQSREDGLQSNLPTLQQHYQLLQNEYIKQKQEKYNNLCLNMFKPKPKKR